MSEITYDVLDSSGSVVRSGTGLVRIDWRGSAVVVYEALSDLPVGQYTIVPGDIQLDVRADEAGR